MALALAAALPNGAVPGLSGALAALAASDPMPVVSGGDGAVALRDGSTVTANGPWVVPADTVGAGDGFDAGFLAGRLTTGDVGEALAMGYACGALSTLPRAPRPRRRTPRGRDGLSGRATYQCDHHGRFLLTWCGIVRRQVRSSVAAPYLRQSRPHDEEEWGMRQNRDGWNVGSDPSAWVGIVFVDIDGTLVPAPGSAVHVARYLGTEEEMAKAEAAYAAGQLTNPEIAAVDALAWAGRTEREIDDWLTQLPLVDGIAETVQWCRAHRLLPVMATLAWQPIGKHLGKRFGFAASCGPELEILNGSFTGRVRATLDEFGKRDFALRYAENLGLGPSQCAAIGDSRSDLPLFDEVGLSVAFNADRQARDRASTTVDGGDLRAVTPLLADWHQRIR